MMNRSVVSLSLSFFLLTTGFVDAAIAPRSPEELEKEATHIVSGVVVGVTSRIEKSTIEKAVGIYRDRIFTIRVRVTAISKGEGMKVDDEIEVVAWQPSIRIPPLPGPQGHGPIPVRGDAIRVFLVARDGKSFAPILPNGIVIEKAAAE